MKGERSTKMGKRTVRFLYPLSIYSGYRHRLGLDFSEDHKFPIGQFSKTKARSLKIHLYTYGGLNSRFFCRTKKKNEPAEQARRYKEKGIIRQFPVQNGRIEPDAARSPAQEQAPGSRTNRQMEVIQKFKGVERCATTSRTVISFTARC